LGSKSGNRHIQYKETDYFTVLVAPREESNVLLVNKNCRQGKALENKEVEVVQELDSF
jgi:hypothetical protein